MTYVRRPNARRLGSGLIAREFFTEAARVRVLFYTVGAADLRFHCAEVYRGDTLLHEIRHVAYARALRAFWQGVEGEAGGVAAAALDWVTTLFPDAQGVD